MVGAAADSAARRRLAAEARAEEEEEEQPPGLASLGFPREAQRPRTPTAPRASRSSASRRRAARRRSSTPRTYRRSRTTGPRRASATKGTRVYGVRRRRRRASSIRPAAPRMWPPPTPACSSRKGDATWRRADAPAPPHPAFWGWLARAWRRRRESAPAKRARTDRTMEAAEQATLRPQGRRLRRKRGQQLRGPRALSATVARGVDEDRQTAWNLAETDPRRRVARQA
jgi:hypothetical protein